jgi:hypothetical protein
MAPHPYTEQFVVVLPKAAEDRRGSVGRGFGFDSSRVELQEHHPRR